MPGIYAPLFETVQFFLGPVTNFGGKISKKECEKVVLLGISHSRGLCEHHHSILENDCMVQISNPVLPFLMGLGNLNH